jgi:catechol-2,3-dioxygenase
MTTVTGRLELLALDARDIDKLAAFYTELTGWQELRRESDWITIGVPDGQEVAFQLAPDHVPPQWPGQERPQQVHLDLLVEGREAAAERALKLGATRLADGASWITMADPAGHTFDLVEREGAAPVMGLMAQASIDAADAAGLAHFYADLLGWEVSYEGPEGAMASGDGKNLMFQKVEGYHPPQWPDPQHPQQGHLDLLFADLDEGGRRAVELGATDLKSGGQTFRVFADPAGHPFCVCKAD